MSWALVDFSCVRYSPVEGTHYFYDPAYPASVQFLLSGRWEPWDIGWVKYKAQDPDIQRVAEEAETRLAQDPNSTYTPWPSAPPPGPPPGLGVENAQTPFDGQLPDVVSLSGSTPSSPEYDPALDPDLQYPPGHASASAPTHPPTYASPYGQQGPPISCLVQPLVQPSVQLPIAVSAPMQPVPFNGPNFSNGNAPQPPPQYAQPPGSPLQPATPNNVILSRTRETKILLSIDGDGIRGLSALLLIESLVNAICVKVGQRLDPHQIFDLTGGSSLGGVIAILLCRLRMQAHRAREAYKQVARQVYLNKRDFFVSLDPHVPKPYVDAAALEKEVKTVIGQELGNHDELLLDGREDSGDVFVIATHIEIGSNKPALMRSYQTRRITGPDLDANMPIWQAMKSTAVAPRYMLPQPGVTQRLVIEPGLVDNGTAKNNPVRDILYECRKLFRYANDMMIIVSVGPGSGLNRDNEIHEMANSVEDRNAEARAWGEKFELDHQALMERNWMKYYRFNVPGLEDVPLEEWCHEDEIKEKTSAYLAQPDVGLKFYACVDAITALLLGPQGR